MCNRPGEDKIDNVRIGSLEPLDRAVVGEKDIECRCSVHRCANSGYRWVKTAAVDIFDKED